MSFLSCGLGCVCVVSLLWTSDTTVMSQFDSCSSPNSAAKWDNQVSYLVPVPCCPFIQHIQYRMGHIFNTQTLVKTSCIRVHQSPNWENWIKVCTVKTNWLQHRYHWLMLLSTKPMALPFPWLNVSLSLRVKGDLCCNKPGKSPPQSIGNADRTFPPRWTSKTDTIMEGYVTAGPITLDSECGLCRA